MNTNVYIKPKEGLTPRQRKFLMATLCLKCGKEMPFINEKNSKTCWKCKRGG